MTKQHPPPPSPFSTWTYPPDLPPNIPILRCFSAPFLLPSLPLCLQSCDSHLLDTIKSLPLPFSFPPANHLTPLSTAFTMSPLPFSPNPFFPLLLPTPFVVSATRHSLPFVHVDTSVQAINKNYLWPLNTLNVSATLSYLLPSSKLHVTACLLLFPGNVLRALHDFSLRLLHPSTDILPLFFLPDPNRDCLSFHLVALNTTHCAPPTTPPPAKPTWTTAGKQKTTAKPAPVTPSLHDSPQNFGFLRATCHSCSTQSTQHDRQHASHELFQS